jgi:uncharacterized pyridoxal phosphate-containing UPF0001 family protein
MKKRTKYMSDETFSELKESLEQALQHARGERDDLRVTIVPASPGVSVSSIRLAVARELSSLSEVGVQQVADFIAFLKFKERLASHNEENLTAA